MALDAKGLIVSFGGRKIIDGLDLSLPDGQIHALMGANGTGKSTLAKAISGHPGCDVKGVLFLDGEDLLSMSPEERARKGVFLAFQTPTDIPGVTLNAFLLQAFRQRFPRSTPHDYNESLKYALESLGLDRSFLEMPLDKGSGGERKRREMLQMLVLKPRLAILDEPDSGLDVDGLKLVAQALSKLRSPGFSALIITHYRRLLEYLEPDSIHVMANGKIVRSGGEELAQQIESEGFRWSS